MIIVSKDRMQIVNLNLVTAMYVGDRGTIKVKFDGTDGCQVAKYTGEELARLAIEKLGEAAMRKAEVFVFPEDDDLRRELESEKYRHITGKKTKGHGGS